MTVPALKALLPEYDPTKGPGCGAMFYEGHITSLAARGKNDLQCQLHDDLFAKVNALLKSTLRISTASDPK